jgi:hypothetical protein
MQCKQSLANNAMQNALSNFCKLVLELKIKKQKVDSLLAKFSKLSHNILNLLSRLLRYLSLLRGTISILIRGSIIIRIRSRGIVLLRRLGFKTTE